MQLHDGKVIPSVVLKVALEVHDTGVEQNLVELRVCGREGEVRLQGGGRRGKRDTEHKERRPGLVLA
jgi:hypothetical protein